MYVAAALLKKTLPLVFFYEFTKFEWIPFLYNSSIVKWGYPDNLLIYFFYFFFDEKISLAQKHVTPRSLCARKKLLPLLFSISLFLFCYLIFACDVFLCARNLFLKKNKQAWNCLDSLNLQYYWGVPLSTHLSRIYLYALIFICDHLWESLLFMKIFLNIFLFMITCEKRMNPII